MNSYIRPGVLFFHFRLPVPIRAVHRAPGHVFWTELRFVRGRHDARVSKGKRVDVVCFSILG